MLNRGLIFISVFALIFPLFTQATTVETYKFVERTGDKQVTIDWRLEKGELYKITSSRADESNILLNDLSFETLEWSLNRPSEDTRIEAKREKDRIIVKGFVHGALMDRAFCIDHSPWFQSTCFSLRKLVKSENDLVEFWMLRPDNLNVIKLRAKKCGVEGIELNGRDVEVQKIQLRPTGIRSIFYSSHYWFTKDAGVFVRFEGPSNIPGCPKTIITLKQEINRFAEKL